MRYSWRYSGLFFTVISFAVQADVGQPLSIQCGAQWYSLHRFAEDSANTGVACYDAAEALVYTVSMMISEVSHYARHP